MVSGERHPGVRAVRRSERAMTDEADIVGLLAQAAVCRIATSVGDEPYIVARTFWYEDRCVYVHGAREGRFLANVAANPKVCLEVDWVGRWLPAQTAAGFGVEYASVVAFGRARDVSDTGEKRNALSGLLAKYFPDWQQGVDYRAISEGELAATSVTAIDIEAWSGKHRLAPAQD